MRACMFMFMLYLVNNKCRPAVSLPPQSVSLQIHYNLNCCTSAVDFDPQLGSKMTWRLPRHSLLHNVIFKEPSVCKHDPSSVCVCSSVGTMDLLFQVLFSPLPTPAIVSLFALAAAVLFYLNTRPCPIHTPVDLKHQTVGIKVRTVDLFPTETCAERRKGGTLGRCVRTVLVLHVLRMERGRLLCWRITTTWWPTVMTTQRLCMRFFREGWKCQVTFKSKFFSK